MGDKGATGDPGQPGQPGKDASLELNKENNKYSLNATFVGPAKNTTGVILKTTGKVTGSWKELKTKCETYGEGAHLCTPEEIYRSLQMGILTRDNFPRDANKGGGFACWMAGPLDSQKDDQGRSSYTANCQGWTSNSTLGSVLFMEEKSDGGIFISSLGCSEELPVACCK